MDVVLPDLFLEPVTPVQPDFDLDDDQSDTSSEQRTHQQILPPHSHNIRKCIIDTVHCSNATDDIIRLCNPLGIFYLASDAPLVDEILGNQLIRSIQLEHCNMTSSVIKGGVLVIELSSEHKSEIMDLPYEHIKFVEFIVALYAHPPF